MNETQLENLCLDWFAENGWEVVHGIDIAPDSSNPLRKDDKQILLEADLQAAFERISAKCFVVSFSTDWRFSPERSHEIVRALIAAEKPVQYLEVMSQHGHDAFLMEDAAYMRGMHAYMGKIAKEVA